MNRRRIRAAAIGAVASLATLAAVGQATADIRTFKVTAEGTAAYSRYDEQVGPAGPVHQQSVAAHFTWHTTLPRLSFDSETGRFVGGGSSSVGEVSGNGEEEMIVYGYTGGDVIRNPGSCEADGVTAVDGGIAMTDVQAPPTDEPGAALIVRPFDGVRMHATCTGGLAGHNQLTIWNGAQPPEAFDHRFFLPKEATDQALIIQHVEQQPDQRGRCAMSGPNTKSCTLQWSGKLTFELVEVTKTPPPVSYDDLFFPLRPQPDSDDDFVLPLEPHDPDLRKPTLSPRGDKASVEVSCPGGCAGTVKAYAAAGAKASSSASRPLATKRFRAPAGRPRKVVLRFAGPARAAIRKAGAVRLVVQVGETRQSLVARTRR